MTFKPRVLAASLAAIMPCHFALAADAPKTYTMDEVVVTAPMTVDPLTVVTNPKAPRQPVPAHDGADYLKSIPGFSVIRKGGTDGDPVLRGMAASRLNVLINGEYILGGCGMRMDPPTAYVFPESFDQISVVKGPQTVLWGGGNSGGTAMFERKTKRLDQFGTRFQGSLLLGGFGRNDQMVDGTVGNAQGYFRAIGTRSDANDYEDGNGNKVHSSYTRWSGSALAGWTPDKDTRLELSVDRSDGQAAYADRSMDGVKFERTGYGLKFEKAAISPLVEKVEAQVYHNYVDHVMDNYTLRPVGMTKMVNNPDRTTVGGRLAGTFKLAAATRATFGLDYQDNEHTLRKASGAGVDTYTSLSRDADMSFNNVGIFGEATHDLSDKDRLVGGLRLDWAEAKDERTGRTTSGLTDKDTLKGGFARWERDITAIPAVAYLGLGHSERAPDYWERTKNPAATSNVVLGSASTFLLNPEKSTQLDTGLIYSSGPTRASLSAYYAKIKDFILIRQVNMFATDARNIDATTYGGEAELSYALGRNWSAYGTLAYVHGENDTDNVPLAQMPPFEARLGVNYDDKVWSAGFLVRAVAEQDRVQPGYGNVVGQDIGRTAGFGVFSVNAGWRPKKGALLTAGIDNLFDRTYAEHLSRAGSAVTGFTTTTRVNEPGRFFWLKLNLAMD